MSDKRASLLAPRYWPAWLAFGWLRGMVTLLPWSLNLAVGRGIGRLAWRIGGKRVAIARRNIERCFPELSASEQEDLAKRHFSSLGMALFETAAAWWLGKARLDRHIEIVGREHLDTPLAAGKGVILVVAHTTLMELSGRFISDMLGDQPRALMYRPADNPVLEYIMAGNRAAKMGRLIDRNDVRGMVRGLRHGEIIWYASDQNYAGRHSVFAPFFGIPAATNPGTSRLARLGRAPVIMGHVRRTSDSGRYRLHFEPPLADFPGDSVEQDAARINAVIERWVRAAPEQYLWIHRRFKSRPRGEEPFYD